MKADPGQTLFLRVGPSFILFQFSLSFTFLRFTLLPNYSPQLTFDYLYMFKSYTLELDSQIVFPTFIMDS